MRELLKKLLRKVLDVREYRKWKKFLVFRICVKGNIKYQIENRYS